MGWRQGKSPWDRDRESHHGIETGEVTMGWRQGKSPWDGDR